MTWTNSACSSSASGSSERSLEGDLPRAIAKLDEAGWLYEKDGAKWFKASELGDDKDRVVVRRMARPPTLPRISPISHDKLERCSGTALLYLRCRSPWLRTRLNAAPEALGEGSPR